MKRFILSLSLAVVAFANAAAAWTTHFAYNSVNQIAAGSGTVYAVSSGALFSIDMQTEKIRTYSHQDGMHGTDIVCIQWLDPIQSLMIVYATGKIDLLNSGQFRYIADLYNKDVTFSKYCHSVTVHDSLVYMAMDYGIQTFHIRKKEFVDTYFIGSNGKETPVYSVALTDQTIYAAGRSELYTASLSDNIVDYRFWSKIPLPSNGDIQSISAAAGVLYLLQNNTCYRLQGSDWQAIDNNKYYALSVVDGQIYPAAYPVLSAEGLWMAAGEQGVLRRFETGEEVAYKLNGPLNNTPYRLHFDQGQLFMLAGGRWATQNWTPGCVMRYDGNKWHNITRQDIINAVGDNCYDFMNAAVDPNNPDHYFVTSYGTGMYEFLNDKCVKRWNTTNSILGAAAADNPARYTRTDGAIYDRQGNLWVMNTGNINYNIVIFAADGSQVGMNVNQSDGSRFIINTAGQFIFDKRNTDHVWALVPRGNETEAGLALIDTKGTLTNTEDDHTLIRTGWTDETGASITRRAFHVMRQDAHANIWLASEDGILIIPSTLDYFTSDQCRRLHIYDAEGAELFLEEEINDIVFDHLDRPWIATKNMGVYVLSPDADEVVEHYVMDNSALPSNSILSLAYDEVGNRMYIGSALGLVSYSDKASDAQTDTNQGNEPVDWGSMMQWTTHFAYTEIDDIQLSANRVFALSEGSLCSIDKTDESLSYYSKLNGLNGSSINRIDYDSYTQQLVIGYDDGMIDLMDNNEVVHSVADLYLKQMNTSKLVQGIAFRDGKAYMAMQFGIMVVNLRKREISDTYYIGENGTELATNAIALVGDTIFAAADNYLYRACINDNLVDYAQWTSTKYTTSITHLLNHDDNLYMLMDGVIYRSGQKIASSAKFVDLSAYRNSLLARTSDKRIFEVTATTVNELSALTAYSPHCAKKDGNTYWLGTDEGVVHILEDKSVQKYQPNGPLSNQPYSLTTFGSELWVLPGARWASGFMRVGKIMYHNGKQWDNMSYADICRRLGSQYSLYDFMHTAVDPADTKHFYVASYGTGLIEFYADGTAKRFNHTNTYGKLTTLVTGNNSYRYCRIDALTFDADRNLWFVNVGGLATNIHVIDPNNPDPKNWHSFNLYQGGQRIVLNLASKFLVDNRNQRYKWIASPRETAGVVFFDDNQTPYNNSDDKVVFRTTFVDQDSKSITLGRLMTIAQDHNGDMWLGTDEGLLIIEASTNLLSSNACKRLKISRHDGTNLADYLLGTEQINAIAFAGGNRVWLGTEASGVYLVHMVTKEGIYEPEILAHFTTLNSPMPSDNILSIAINDENGEVYIGTAKGLVSYRGDATAPHDTFSDAYVYPNPVRPNYEGVITINGLMDNTTVYIADASGNVVCRTHSNGGTAVWDGRTQSGKRAHSGVYSIYCNTADGTNHTVLKVLIMN